MSSLIGIRVTCIGLLRKHSSLLTGLDGWKLRSYSRSHATCFLWPDYSAMLAQSSCAMSKHDFHRILILPVGHHVHRVHTGRGTDLNRRVYWDCCDLVRQFRFLALLLSLDPSLPSSSAYA